MKFGITKFEKFALTAGLVQLPTPNMEIGRVRLRAWDELGTETLAQSLAMAAAGIPQTLTMADWADHAKAGLVNLSPEVVAWLISSLEGAQKPGVVSDVLTRLHGRLCDLRDKKYRLPEELRRTT